MEDRSFFKRVFLAMILDKNVIGEISQWSFSITCPSSTIGGGFFLSLLKSSYRWRYLIETIRFLPMVRWPVFLRRP